MGKGDRIPSKQSSSARAAEVLTSRIGAAGVGFGGYVGGTSVGSNAAGFGFGAAFADRLVPAPGASEPSRGEDATASETSMMMQMDGELAQYIRRLSKKDPITKAKALQNLRTFIPSRSTADLLIAMPQWIYMYKRLIMDSSHIVRSETATTLTCLVKALGRAVAPHLKSVLGPWFLAMYDPHSDAASSSSSAFRLAFPAARRQLEVVLYCRAELLTYLKDHLLATPQQLGDPKKESTEELETRHERVLVACLAALAGLITMMSSPLDASPTAVQEFISPASAEPAGRDEVLSGVRDVYCRPGFWKATAGSRSAAVRRAAYSLARCAAQHVSGSLLEGCAAESAVCVLGALGEKEAGNHGPMWEAVLTYAKFCPDAWRHVNMRKMILPRMYALLRNGCYGSATVSLPALLPLLPLLPTGTLGPSPEVLVSVLEAVWTGMQNPVCMNMSARSASLSAYRECLAWGLTSSPRLAAQVAVTAPGSNVVAAGPDDAMCFCRSLLHGTLVQHVLPAALGSGVVGEGAREIVAGLDQVLASAAVRSLDVGPAAISQACLTDTVCQFVGSALTRRVAARAAVIASGSGDDVTVAEGQLAALCDGTAALLLCVRRDAAGCAPGLAERIAVSIVRGLTSAGPSGLTPATSQLLATLLREYGSTAVSSSESAMGAGEARWGTGGLAAGPAGAGGDGAQADQDGGVIRCGSLNLDSLVVVLKAAPLTGATAEATTDLIVAFCASRDGSTALWEQVLAAVLPSWGRHVNADSTAASTEVVSTLDINEQLQRALLLLQRCAVIAAREGTTASSGAQHGAADAGGTVAAKGQQQPNQLPWASSYLDEVAVRIAQRDESATQAESEQEVQEVGSSAALLSAALGKNAAGLVFLRPPAARQVVQLLTEQLMAYRGDASDGSSGAAPAHAASFAISVLAGPLSSGNCGIWQMLPGEACAALVAMAQLNWQAPCSRPAGHLAAHTSCDVDDESSSGESGDAFDSLEDEGDMTSQSLSSSEEGSDIEVEVGAGPGDGSVEAPMREAQNAAARFWRGARPLAAAAEALPADQTDGLVRTLTRLMVQCTSGSPSAAGRPTLPQLSPRAWALHAAHMLTEIPGGRARRQSVLDALLEARGDEWRAWSSLAAHTSRFSGPPSSRSGNIMEPAFPAGQPEPSLEYLARLVEAVGPEAVLDIASGGIPSEETAGDCGMGVGREGGPEGGGAAAATAGRCWLLVEMLCSHYAAATQTAADAMVFEEQEEEEEEAIRRRPIHQRLRRHVSAAWRRTVGRAVNAMLDYVVHSAMAEAVEHRGSCRGVHGILLNSLVDELAEGCRDGGTTAPSGACDMGSELLPAQAVFLEALCHLGIRMQQPSLDDRRRVDLDGGVHFPLLHLQQHLCKYWLSTSRPDTSTGCGLPLHALLRLLPLTAGPLRRAAAARAATDTQCSAAEDVLRESGLPDLSCAWLKHSLSRPPVLLNHTASAATALELVAACFPSLPKMDFSSSTNTRQSTRAAAVVMELVRSGGMGLASSERPLLKQMVQHQLGQHTGIHISLPGQLQSGIAAASSPAMAGAKRGPVSADALSTRPDQLLAAYAVVMSLAHAAVVYDWRRLGSQEWHALARAVQVQLGETVSALADCLRKLAAAARTAADSVLRHSLPEGTTPGPMALQLLRKLAGRGLLESMIEVQQLEEDALTALETCVIGPATNTAAQLAAVMANLQDEVAHESGDGTTAGAAVVSREYCNSMESCYSHSIQLAICLGGVECYGAAFGPKASAAVSAWMSRHHTFWAAVTRCAGHALQPGREHLGSRASVAAATAQASVLSQTGLDAVGALLAIALTPGTHALQPVAYRLLLGDALLPVMTLVESASSGLGADSEIPEYDGDDTAFLVAGGIRTEMAPWLLQPPPTSAIGHSGRGGIGRVHLTAWALLLAHMLSLDARSRGVAVLRQLLREVEPLVHDLLGRLVQEMGIQRRQQHQGEKLKRVPQSESCGGGVEGVTAVAMMQSSASADVERWRLAEALRDIGSPCELHALHATCRMLYRAVLRALPATARGWFGELRDRGLAASVESYTAAVEGPALLAAEVASVQSSEYGPDERFSIRTCRGSREVVATMEVEDGAVLELVVKLPACLPLRAPEVECRCKVGVNETRLRKWLLSIATFLRHQNGSVADAIALWKRNVDSEFEGVEACLICYSVISSVNGQLPRLVCRTCNVCFHPACLYKWFKSAGKSQCPHCQSLW